MIVVSILAAHGCREKYVPPVTQPATGYLVVDGFINSGPGNTTFTLSRTTKLGNGLVQYETKAVVSVEGKLNTTAVVLAEVASTPGVYTAAVNINPADQYRLRIITQGGKEYLSDYSAMRRTPAIDSISWKQETDGVYIYGSTHNTTDSIGFYYWKFDETWEIHSQYFTRLKVFYDPVVGPHHVGYRDSATFADVLSLFFCWKDASAKKILITSTEKLKENRSVNFQLRHIPTGAEELAVRYSMNAKLSYISREHYKSLELLRKNTELLGSIFDSQPSENLGNVRSVASPSETVIGFVEVTEEKVQRIFIDQQQVTSWRYRSGCALETKIANTPPLEISAAHTPTQVSKFNRVSPNLIDSVFVAPTECVVCTVRGYNVKPSFW